MAQATVTSPVDMTPEIAREQILRAVQVQIKGQGVVCTLEALLRVMPRAWRQNLSPTKLNDEPYSAEMAQVVVNATMALLQEGKIKFVPSMSEQERGRGPWDFAVQFVD